MSFDAIALVMAMELPSPGMKLLLIALANFVSNGGNTCFPSQETLSRITSMSPRAVRDNLSRLKAGGYIRTQHRSRDGKRTSDYYELNLTLAKPAAEIAGSPVADSARDPVREEPVKNHKEIVPVETVSLGEFGWARMTKEQLAKLESKYPAHYMSCIERFDRWVEEAPGAKASNGVRRRDRKAYLTVCAWIDRDVENGKSPQPVTVNQPRPFQSVV